MSGHFNGLSPAEAERLAYLSEELGEAQQAVGKILRHGYDSYNPCAPEKGDNREQLAVEIAQVRSAVERMTEACDLDQETIDLMTPVARQKSDKWMHHQ